MFTGLVEAVGQVLQIQGDSPRRLTIRAPQLGCQDIPLGASIAIDGCCLTVVQASTDSLTFEAATETLQRTTIGALEVGKSVNLEQALRVGDRLGGHLVAGHVDGVGVVRALDQRGSALYVGVQVPADILRLSAPRGSITLAGVSLTVTDVDDRQSMVWVGLIPHTLEVTTLGQWQIGTAINVEADLVARYVTRSVMAERQ